MFAYRRPAIVLAACFLAGCSSFEQASEAIDAGSSAPTLETIHAVPHLSPFRAGTAPRGFESICGEYPWACSNETEGTIHDDKEIVAIARKVNARVNRRIRPLSDPDQFGVSERWTLPTSGAGDCEDYVLMKLKELIDAGVPPNRVFMAQVLPRSWTPHVVLIVRTAAGDHVLDNLRQDIRLWHETDYAFLKMQNSEDAAAWDIVLLGPRTSRR